MTREELLERIMWAVDGWRFGFLTQPEMVARITELMEVKVS